MHKYSEHAPLGFGEVFKCLSVHPEPEPIILSKVQLSYNEMTSNTDNGYTAISSSNSIDGEDMQWYAEDDRQYTYTPSYAYGAFMDIPEQRILDGYNCLGCLFSCYDYNAWVGQQLPEAAVANQYSFYLPDRWNDYGTNYPISTWTFEGSNDGTQWTELHRATSMNWTWENGKYESPVFENTTPYTYYRLHLYQDESYYWYGVALFKFYNVVTDGVKEPHIECVKYLKSLDTFATKVMEKPLPSSIPVPYACYDKDFRIQVDLAGREPNLFLRMFYGHGHTTQITGMMKDRCDIHMPYASWSGNKNGPFSNTKVVQITNSTAWRLDDNANMMEQYLSNDFTIEFWAYQTNTNSGVIIQFDQDTNCRLLIDNYDNRWVPWVSSNGSNWDILDGDHAYSADTAITDEASRGYCQITLNTWQHVAFVHHGNYWYLFVDGVLSMIRQRSGTWYQNSDGIQVCRGHGTDYQWYGRLYDLRIWTTAKYTVPDGTTTAAQGTKFFTPETEPAI